MFAAAAECKSVIPLGEAVGVSIQTDGILVTDTVASDSGGAYRAGIRKGDIIVSADGVKFSNSDELAEYIKNSDGVISFSVLRNGRAFQADVEPISTESGVKIGVWVRDSTAGIGTLTFYDCENNCFGGLGHGISDVDTGDILPIKKGNILSCTLSEPTKGERNSPGELNGVFSSEITGEVKKNNSSGIFGTAVQFPKNVQSVETASAEEVKQGDAVILSNVDGKGVKEYKVEIDRIINRQSNGKNMIIRVTDEELLRKTGGIVQGMSGSPILQNGRMVGAVTHVCVNL